MLLSPYTSRCRLRPGTGLQPLNLFVTVCGLTPHYPHYNQLVTPAPAADLDSCWQTAEEWWHSQLVIIIANDLWLMIVTGSYQWNDGRYLLSLIKRRYKKLPHYCPGSAIFLQTVKPTNTAKEDNVCLYTPRFWVCQFGSVQYCEIGREGVREAHTEADTTTSLSAQQYLGIY